MKIDMYIIFQFLVLFNSAFAQEPELKISPKIRFVSELNAGYLGGQESSPLWQVKNGFLFANHFNAMIGLGYERYYSNPYLPIFLELKYNILNRKTTPFVALSSGYLQPLSQSGYNKMIGGYTGGGKIGVSHFITEHIGFETSLGYRFSQIERKSYWPYSFNPLYCPEIVYQTNNLHCFELIVGFIFK